MDYTNKCVFFGWDCEWKKMRGARVHKVSNKGRKSIDFGFWIEMFNLKNEKSV